MVVGRSRRSWESTCGDCEQLANGYCPAAGRAADAMDSFAAICEWFEPMELDVARQSVRRDFGGREEPGDASCV